MGMVLTPEERAELKGVISFWEAKLKTDQIFMSISTVALIGLTVKFLKKLSGVGK